MKGNEVKSCVRFCKKCCFFCGSKWVLNFLVVIMLFNVIEIVKFVFNDIFYFDEDMMLQDGIVDVMKWCGIKCYVRIFWLY